MANSGQPHSNSFPNVDLWCARNIRKIPACCSCLHYEECLKKGESVAPSAIEHKYANSVIPKQPWDEPQDDEED